MRDGIDDMDCNRGKKQLVSSSFLFGSWGNFQRAVVFDPASEADHSFALLDEYPHALDRRSDREGL